MRWALGVLAAALAKKQLRLGPRGQALLVIDLEPMTRGGILVRATRSRIVDPSLQLFYAARLT